MLAGQSELVELLAHVSDLLTATGVRVIELSPVESGAIQITLVVDEQPAGILEYPVPSEALEAFVEFFKARVAPWPVLTGPLGTCRDPAPRLLLAPTTGHRAICSVELMSEHGRPLIQLREVANIDLPSVQDLIKEEIEYGTELAEVLNSSVGLVIANHCESGTALDAARLCVAARPDALLASAPAGTEALRELLELAQERFVVLMLPQTDPVEMLTTLKRLCFADRSLEQLAAKVLLAAWATLAIRKSCAECSRPTPPPAAFLERIPASLGHLVQTSYLFGRGCNHCNFSAYQGHTLMSSWLRLASKTRLEFLNFAATSALYRLALENGTRAIFEDGVRKVFDGSTSFDELFALVSTMPLAMEATRPGIVRRPLVPAAAVENQNPNLSAARPTILLVEDNVIQREIISAFLRQASYEVLSTEDGVAALEFLNSRAVDLIICDVMMPLMNGIDFVKQLRASAHRDIPVVMLTAVHDSRVEFELLDAGADDYCEKNVKKGILLKRVEKLLNRDSKPSPKSADSR